MKAYWITPGPTGTGVELRETPTPEPKAGEVLVRVRATSLNRGELLDATNVAGAQRRAPRPRPGAASARARSSSSGRASPGWRSATA